MTTVHIKGLTEEEAAGIQTFQKPAPGSWTEAFGLDKGPVDFKDSYDPEFYELEKEAVFRRNWLSIGRVEQLPRPGSYFTRELDVLKVSVLVLRGMDGEIRAFHNVCSHRGNKLMWDDFPSKESSGNCRQIACKYHGWRFNLEGEIDYVHNAPEFFDLKAEDLALPKINVDVWAGFIFVYLDQEPRETLREFLTPEVAALESYPFGQLTQRHMLEEEDVQANWKLYIDQYQELYHVPFLHGSLTAPNTPQTGTDKVPYMIPSFGKHGKHRRFTSTGPGGNRAVLTSRPVDALFRSGFFGFAEVPDLGSLGDGVNPDRVAPWGLDSWFLYPNTYITIFAGNFYTVSQWWPHSVGAHRYTYEFFFTPPKNAAERLAQDHCLMTLREFANQDANSPGAVYQSIRSGARNQFYLADQEVLIRYHRKVIHDDVEAYQQELAAKGSRG
jgi:phenylpropionate dioxygenase-like ring-hydroxylating dioxygenase large terminal subunit